MKMKVLQYRCEASGLVPLAIYFRKEVFSMIRRERERELRSYSMALTVPEVAEILRVCTKTVYKLIKEGSIPHVKIGREIRVPKGRLIDYLQNSA